MPFLLFLAWPSSLRWYSFPSFLPFFSGGTWRFVRDLGPVSTREGFANLSNFKPKTALNMSKGKVTNIAEMFVIGEFILQGGIYLRAGGEKGKRYQRRKAKQGRLKAEREKERMSQRNPLYRSRKEGEKKSWTNTLRVRNRVKLFFFFPCLALSNMGIRES